MVAIFQEGNKSGIIFRRSGWLVLGDASFFFLRGDGVRGSVTVFVAGGGQLSPCRPDNNYIIIIGGKRPPRIMRWVKAGQYR